jgi:ribosomal protein S18 acetylase RimI-like enzyme
LHDFDIAEVGEAYPMTPARILSEWEGLDPMTDAWLVLAPDGSLAGYATLADEGAGRLLADGYVHPNQQGQGIGSALVELAEHRAADMTPMQPAGARLVLVNNVWANSLAGCTLLEARGYELTRVFFTMQMLLDAFLPLAEWPEGTTLRACDGSEADIRRAYETAEEGFTDHWAHIPRSFEDWRKETFTDPVDPSLWFLVQQGNHAVGTALCRVRSDGSGWINQVAVLRPWRKQGLGLALLRHAFTIFHQRGIRKIGLSVDGQSLTGANRLYERAGMHVSARIARYEKELRSGTNSLVKS